MKSFFNRRVALLTLILVILSVAFFSFVPLKVFPCIIFVWDSRDGYMFDMCSLFDDGKLVFASDSSGYYANSSVLTWFMAGFLFLILPYLSALLVNRLARKV